MQAAGDPDPWGNAYMVVNQAATIAAAEIAAEMVSRPWPYEITPPDRQVPPVRGLSTSDRLAHFTILSGATGSEALTHGCFYLKCLGTGTSLAAYAQAEAFNGNEFPAHMAGVSVSIKPRPTVTQSGSRADVSGSAVRAAVLADQHAGRMGVAAAA